MQTTIISINREEVITAENMGFKNFYSKLYINLKSLILQGMTKSLLVTILLCGIVTAVTAQEWKRPIDLGGDYLNKTINSVYFTDENIGWAVGVHGVILKT